MNYDIKLVAKRLAKLRKQNNNISLKKLSDGIKEKTGIQISHTQLNKYENIENPDIMNIINFAAIADYYNVSYDFLLGYSESKIREFDSIQKQTGLSDKSIFILKNWYEHINVKVVEGEFLGKIKTTIAPIELNKMIENRKFYKLIYYIRSLNYIPSDKNDEENDESLMNHVLSKAKINALINELGRNSTREYVMHLIQDLFKDIVDDIVPYTPIDEEDEATEADLDDMLGPIR